MERLAGFIIIVGTVLWLISVLFLGGRWQWQMFAALVLIIGIFTAHFWEELSEGKNKNTPKDDS
jgi:fatty acid desaturase